LSIDALSCPRCSGREGTVPLTVLAFLSDPEVVVKILRHLGWPTAPPPLSPARCAPEQLLLEVWQPALGGRRGEELEEGEGPDREGPEAGESRGEGERFGRSPPSGESCGQ
jgi:hypothetical protein